MKARDREALSRGARRLLEHLKRTYCRKQRICWPSRARLAREIRRSESQLYRLLSELIENGLVESTQRGQTSAILELKPACFQRNWLENARAARADARADARAARAVLISERTTLNEEESPHLQTEEITFGELIQHAERHGIDIEAPGGIEAAFQALVGSRKLQLSVPEIQVPRKPAGSEGVPRETASQHDSSATH